MPFRRHPLSVEAGLVPVRRTDDAHPVLTWVCAVVVYCCVLFAFSAPALAKDFQISNDAQTFLYIKSSTGNVGIFTGSPSATLDVNGIVKVSAGATSQSKIVNVTGTFPDQTVSRTGLYVDVNAGAASGAVAATGSWSEIRTTADTGTYATIVGAYSEALHSGLATVDTMMGATSLANQTGAGTVTNAFGLYPQVWKGASGGQMTNAYGLYFQGVPLKNGDTGSTLGALENQYGIAVGHLTTGTARNVAFLIDDDTTGTTTLGSFGILQESTAPNSFAGNIGVGTTVPDASLVLYSGGTTTVADSHVNADITGAYANESRYVVGKAGDTRATPSDVQKFRFYSGFGAFQEVAQINVNVPAVAAGPTALGAIDFYTQGASGPDKRVTIDQEGLHVKGGQALKRTPVNNTDYTVLIDDYLIAFTAPLTAPRTVTLPAAFCTDGRVFVIKDESGNAAVNNIIIAPAGGKTIDGGATFAVNSPYNAVEVYCGNGQWYVK